MFRNRRFLPLVIWVGFALASSQLARAQGTSGAEQKKSAPITVLVCDPSREACPVTRHGTPPPHLPVGNPGGPPVNTAQARVGPTPTEAESFERAVAQASKKPKGNVVNVTQTPNGLKFTSTSVNNTANLKHVVLYHIQPGKDAKAVPATISPQALSSVSRRSEVATPR